jgi:phosphoglycerate dehydrogenase-like enzyme
VPPCQSSTVVRRGSRRSWLDPDAWSRRLERLRAADMQGVPEGLESLPKGGRHGKRRVGLKIGVVGNPGERGWRSLGSLGEIAHCVDILKTDSTELAEAEALLVWDFRWKSLDALLPEVPLVRWIHTASAGVEHVLVEAVKQGRIVLTNSAGVFDQPIAEYVLGLVLAHSKGLIETALAQRDHRWAYRQTLNIHGRVLLIVGLGRIGRTVGQLAAAAGMRVIGVTSRGARVEGVETVDRDALAGALGEADYVVITAALTPETLRMIDTRTLALMKRSAYLINVARGQILDTDALVEALSRGAISGAALDVFDQEPLPSDSPLWSVPNLLVSPHMSGDSEDFDLKAIELFIANVHRFVQGEPLLNVVDPGRGY